MKPVFYPLRISHIEKQTQQAVSIEFDIPEDLRPAFSYLPGQYLTIKHNLNGEEVRRNYSLCSSPAENKWVIAVKKVAGGAFSTYANEGLKAGDTLEVMPPMGKFTPVADPAPSKHVVAFAAGSGITPILSILKATLAGDAGSSFTLIYGNRSRSSIIFKEEIEALKNRYINRLAVYHVLSREKTDSEINYGRIDAAKCEQIFRQLVDIRSVGAFYLCGPEEMSDAVKQVLLSKGVEEPKIRLELFSTANRAKRVKSNLTQTPDDQPKSRVTVLLDGIESSFDLAFDSDPILDAAIHEGIEVPYACKGGMCCTCKAKLVKGEVEMEVHYGLEHDEIAAGYILTCQSHPKTAEVLVDYDAR